MRFVVVIAEVIDFCRKFYVYEVVLGLVLGREEDQEEGEEPRRGWGRSQGGRRGYERAGDLCG